jgi:HEAT repeat protein
MKNAKVGSILFAAAAGLLVLCGPACSPERKDWKAAERLASPGAYEDYLSKYPDGKHAAEARARAEEFDFREAETTDSAEGYRQFLKEHPDGPFAARASGRIDELDWAAAETDPTLASLGRYLREHPSGAHTDSARAEVEAIRDDRIPEFRDVNTIGFVLRQSFDEEVEGVTLGFESVLEKFYPYFGLEKAGAGTPGDAVLTIACEAQASGASYSAFPGSFTGTFYYTGASVSGRAVLDVAGKKTLREDFSGDQPVPYSISGSSATDPSDAPYDAAMEDGFPPQTARLLARAFGYRGLVGALGSFDAGVGDAAIDAFANGGPTVLNLLLGALESPGPRIRSAAATALGGHRDPKAVAALILSLSREGDPNEPLRRNAAESLSKIGISAFPALEEASKDGRAVVRQGAAAGLAGIKNDRSLACLVGLFGDPDEAVRRAAVRSVGEFRTRASIAALIDGLAGSDKAGSEAFISALEDSSADTTDEESEDIPSFDWPADLAGRFMKAVIPHVADPGLSERLASLAAEIGAPGFAPAGQSLKAGPPAVRSWAADVLGRSADERAIPLLAQAAADPEPAVRLAVAKALKLLSFEGTIEPLGRLLRDSAPEVRDEALSGLKDALLITEGRSLFQRHLSSPEALGVLVEFLTGADAAKISARDNAAAVLGRIGRPAAGRLLEALKSPNPLAREGAITALGSAGDEAGVAALIETAGDPAVQSDDDLVAKIYRALGTAKNKKAVALLTAGLKDAAIGRKSAAADALRELGDIRAVDALVEALGPENASIQGTLEEAIRELTQHYPEDEPFDWKAWWPKNRARFGLK